MYTRIRVFLPEFFDCDAQVLLSDNRGVAGRDWRGGRALVLARKPEVNLPKWRRTECVSV